MSTVRLELVSETSSKFWEITTKGSSHTVRYGRLGSAGQVKTKKFASAAKALASATKLIEAKYEKGYDKPPSKRKKAAKKKSSAVHKPTSRSSAKKVPKRKDVALRPPKDKLGLVHKRISPFIGAMCGYFPDGAGHGEFLVVRIFDWSKFKAKDKAIFWEQILGDVSSAKDFPTVVDVTYEDLGDGKRAIRPTWRDDRWLPIAFSNVDPYAKWPHVGAVELMCVDLTKVTKTKVPVHSVSIDGTLVNNFKKVAPDLSKLGWYVVEKLTL